MGQYSFMDSLKTVAVDALGDIITYGALIGGVAEATSDSPSLVTLSALGGLFVAGRRAQRYLEIRNQTYTIDMLKGKTGERQTGQTLEETID